MKLIQMAGRTFIFKHIQLRIIIHHHNRLYNLLLSSLLFNYYLIIILILVPFSSIMILDAESSYASLSSASMSSLFSNLTLLKLLNNTNKNYKDIYWPSNIVNNNDKLSLISSASTQSQSSPYSLLFHNINTNQQITNDGHNEKNNYRHLKNADIEDNHGGNSGRSGVGNNNGNDDDNTNNDADPDDDDYYSEADYYTKKKLYYFPNPYWSPTLSSSNVPVSGTELSKKHHYRTSSSDQTPSGTENFADHLISDRSDCKYSIYLFKSKFDF